jgi:transposase
VIGPTGTVRVLVATKPVDFRKGTEGLAALVREEIKGNPFSGTVYVFRAKRADRVKLIFWDGTGMCLFAKRLENGAFRWPNIQGGIIQLSTTQMSALLEGLDWRRVHAIEMPAIAYYLLQQAILHKQGKQSVLAHALGRDLKGKLSPLLYLTAIGLAFVAPWLSIAIYMLVAIIWLVPDRRIEKVLPEA